MICGISTWTTVVNHLAWGCCLTGLAMGLHVSVLLKQGVAILVVVGVVAYYWSFCCFFPNFWRLRADATCWKMGVNYRTSVSSSAWSLGLFKFLLFFPIFEGWGLMQLAEKWESTTEVLCHHQLDLSDYLSFCYFSQFLKAEGWCNLLKNGSQLLKFCVIISLISRIILVFVIFSQFLKAEGWCNLLKNGSQLLKFCVIISLISRII